MKKSTPQSSQSEQSVSQSSQTQPADAVADGRIVRSIAHLVEPSGIFVSVYFLPFSSPPAPQDCPDMDLSTLCNVLQGCLSPDLSIRKAAEDELGKVGVGSPMSECLPPPLTLCGTCMQLCSLIELYSGLARKTSHNVNANCTFLRFSMQVEICPIC